LIQLDPKFIDRSIPILFQIYRSGWIQSRQIQLRRSDSILNLLIDPIQFDRSMLSNSESIDPTRLFLNLLDRSIPSN
jgi:hypothetical protein